MSRPLKALCCDFNCSPALIIDRWENSNNACCLLNLRKHSQPLPSAAALFTSDQTSSNQGLQAAAQDVLECSSSRAERTRRCFSLSSELEVCKAEKVSDHSSHQKYYVLFIRFLIVVKQSLVVTTLCLIHSPCCFMPMEELQTSVAQLLYKRHWAKNAIIGELQGQNIADQK